MFMLSLAWNNDVRHTILWILCPTFPHSAWMIEKKTSKLWVNRTMCELRLYLNACTVHDSVDQTFFMDNQCISSNCHKMEQSVWQRVGETNTLSQMHCGSSAILSCWNQSQ